MSRSDSRAWWQRRLPSVGVLVVVLAVTGLVTMAVARQVGEVLPDVGKDHLGDDNVCPDLSSAIKRAYILLPSLMGGNDEDY